ncbi:MAG: transcriptional repressor [Candidatus Atribacteria bacterium]|nr:transcriptional repressor [Candidatus Atribacteria bacterium]MCD6350177.1 transcriptional repressor [Candidatus Atribacteria bacterium]
MKKDLIRKGLRPSHVIVQVLKYLLEHRTHPTAEEIFSSLSEEMPTLSRTSVYNALRAFAEAGLVKIITVEGDKVRFDADLSDHGHFRCSQCGKIYDFKFSFDGLRWEGLEDFEVESKELYLRGLCPECRLKSTREKEES